MSIPAGEVFRLKDLVTIEEGKVNKVSFASTPDYEIVLAAMPKGSVLPEHPAPGDAIVFALEGQAMINYEGKESIISKGEQILFAKGGKHSVTALDHYKMAIIITKTAK